MHALATSLLHARYPLHGLAILFVSLMLPFLGATAHAQRVTAEIGSRDLFLDEPARVVVRVDDAAEFDGPTLPSVEVLRAAGVEIVRLPGEQTSRSVQILNGRRTERSTVAVTFEVTPRRLGAAEIPPFAVTVAGKELRTAAIPISVARSETGDLMRVSVRASPEPIFVGQQGVLRLELAVKRYRDTEFGITLDEGSIWSLIDRDGSDWGVFNNALVRLLSEGRRPRGEVREIDGAECIVFAIDRLFDPITAGTPDLGEIRIRMDYPTRLRRGSGFLGDSRLTLGASRPISARVGDATVDVRAVPTEGVPPSWNGAVGEFDLVVEARPMSVSVGDPITLTITATDRSGSASLGGLQAPPLAEAPALVDRFRVARDAAVGVVEGRRKVFTQTIRALSDTVEEIPPIELAAFDPATGEFRVVKSAAIPIVVRPSAVVRAIEPAAAEAPAATAQPARAEFTRVEGGLLANASVAECSTQGSLAPSHIALGAVPLAMALAAPFVGRLARSRGDSAASRRRRALGDAERAICAAASGDAVEDSLLRLVGALCDAEAGTLSRKDAAEHLARCGVREELVARLDEFLRRCERARYTGESVDGLDARELVHAVADAVARAERSAS
jgi:hypothetical protein